MDKSAQVFLLSFILLLVVGLIILVVIAAS